ncbi:MULTISPECIES: hypothetical protein [Serratia]|jgi:hypothetical protein|nr:MULTISPECIES: hypothetical protein [Serratia]
MSEQARDFVVRGGGITDARHHRDIVFQPDEGYQRFPQPEI